MVRFQSGLISVFLLIISLFDIIEYLMGILARIKQECKVQYKRYSSAPYGKISAILIYAAAFSLVPNLVKWILSLLLEVMSEKYAYITMVLSTLLFMAFTWNLVMMAIYKIKIPFFEQYRIYPKKPWPWEEDYQKWLTLMKRSIYLTLGNIIFIGGISLFIEVHTMFQIQMDVDKRLPIKHILLQFFLMMLADDIYFFSTHYIFHHSFLYRFHKIHHQYTVSISIAGLHFHFLEFLITQSLSIKFSSFFGAFVGPINISTLVIWIIFRMWDAFNGHCGYLFSWSPLQVLPFCSYDQFHDFHHTRNSGNYGSHFRFWDSLFGTNKQFRQYNRKLQEQKKRK